MGRKLSHSLNSGMRRAARGQMRRDLEKSWIKDTRRRQDERQIINKEPNPKGNGVLTVLWGFSVIYTIVFFIIGFFTPPLFIIAFISLILAVILRKIINKREVKFKNKFNQNKQSQPMNKIYTDKKQNHEHLKNKKFKKQNNIIKLNQKEKALNELDNLINSEYYFNLLKEYNLTKTEGKFIINHLRNKIKKVQIKDYELKDKLKEEMVKQAQYNMEINKKNIS